MKNAKLTVVSFNDNDVIATSGAVSLTWAGLWDSEKANATVTYGGIDYLGQTGNDLAALNTALTGTNITISNTTKFYYTATSARTYAAMVGTKSATQADYGSANPTFAGQENGTYTWDSTKNAFVKSTN